MTIQNQFQDFVTADRPIPTEVQQNIFATQQMLNHPGRSSLLVGMFQFIACAITLLFCPQFGIGSAIWGGDLFHHFFHESPLLCGVYCGFIYLGASTFLAGLVMPCHYLSFLRNMRATQFTLAIFMMMVIFGSSKISGNNFDANNNFYFGWIVSSLISFYLMQALVRKTRKFRFTKLA